MELIEIRVLAANDLEQRAMAAVPVAAFFPLDPTPINVEEITRIYQQRFF